MKLHAAEETGLLKLSESLKLPFASVLQAYVVDRLIRKLVNSSFEPFFWLKNPKDLSQEAYRSSREMRLEFYYVESDKQLGTLLEAGMPFSKELMEVFGEELFGPMDTKIYWKYRVIEENGKVLVQVEASLWDMNVPVSIYIEEIPAGSPYPVRQEIPYITREGKSVSLQCYSPENVFCMHFYEIMSRLELISDMESYDIVYQTLKVQSLSGRKVIDEMEEFVKKEPKVKNLKRVSQIAGYMDYTYMRKRWEKYLRNHKKELVEWKEVLTLFLSFAEPVWKAFCQEELFFKDWMPELGRFLS